MHDDDFDHEHYAAFDPTEQGPIINEVVQERTLGVDVGSTTWELVFSQIHLARMGELLNTRYAVVLREVLYRAPVRLTPYSQSGEIDAAALEALVAQAFDDAGMSRDEVTSGTIVLTGAATRRDNARAIAGALAESGRFVCAAAGPDLEAVLAAHGSGSVALSRRTRHTVLNVDIGGQSTKLALIRDGEVTGTAALRAGGRLALLDDAGRLAQVDPALRDAGEAADAVLDTPEQLGAALAGAIVEAIKLALPHTDDHRHEMSGFTSCLLLTPGLHSHRPVDTITFSGGVAEYVYGAEDHSLGDIGPFLAAELQRRIDACELPAPVQRPGEGIAATVIGATHLTSHVSGYAFTATRPEALPLRHVPVIRPRLPRRDAIPAGEMAHAVHAAYERAGLEPGAGPLAIAVSWAGAAGQPALLDLAAGIVQGLQAHLASGQPLVLAFENGHSETVCRLLRDELHLGNDVIAIDGVQLAEFDFIDVGEAVHPDVASPVVVKVMGVPRGGWVLSAI